VHGAGAEPPRTLIQIGTDMPWLEWADPQNHGAPPFILDDLAREREWHSYHGIIGSVAHLLNTMLVSANNGLKQLNSAADPCMVQRARAPDRRFLFCHF
jgi:hypothetical protein